ncbi:MAG: histidinol-phosphatase HisJ family protein [Oscillibacter sp.]|jgi:histidinol-phosphatase (PHP family)|nr:histidinol-phosphatase HisJ family protein [Oscillibacter sp.]
MYLADYHIHSDWSPDGQFSMEDMAEAAVRAGLSEICFTDHIELLAIHTATRRTFDFSVPLEAYRRVREKMKGRITVRFGFELGEAPRDFPYAEEVLRQLPETDFIIGSEHQLEGIYEGDDLYFCAAHDPVTAREQILEYLELVEKLAKWGKFSVLGHLTLPLRYMNENNGLHMTFDGFEAEVEEVFRDLISRGCGIEVNTNRGNDPLPGKKWLELYRRCGGEIVTLGSDAHSPKYVGCCIREGQELLRACGFTDFCTFERMKPVFHRL